MLVIKIRPAEISEKFLRTMEVFMARDENTNQGTSARGFAAMTPQERSRIAREGGLKSGGQFGKPGGADPSEAGRKGGKARGRRTNVNM